MRRASSSVTLRNEYLLKRIKDIKGEHPFWVIEEYGHIFDI